MHQVAIQTRLIDVYEYINALYVSEHVQKQRCSSVWFPFSIVPVNNLWATASLIEQIELVM